MANSFIYLCMALVFTTTAFTQCAGKLELDGIRASCLGFIYNTHTNNVRNWVLDPTCEKTVESYMTRGPYLRDLAATSRAAGDYFATIQCSSDGKDAVVFDIDDTLLSNIPYLSTHNWGGKINTTEWGEWCVQACAPALHPVRRLFTELKSKGWTVILLTGRRESMRLLTLNNLAKANISGWAELIFREETNHGSAAIYKMERRVELESRGFRVRGCIGDQWSDLWGAAAGDRVFKLPNPMYFIE